MNMMEKMKMMMMMKKMMDNKNHHENSYKDYDYTAPGDNVQGSYKRHDDMSSMYKKMGYQNKMDNYMKSRNDDFSMDSMFRSMGQMRFKRQAGDSLALNDRLKEKVEHVSNMTCVLRELNVIDQNNNIDVNAMKR